MKIKSKYFIEKVFPKLQKDIEKSLEPFPEFKEELFDKLYTFFSRYFSESGSIYFTQTRYHQNIYEKIYTDNKDVILFWKTQMLYYVKTDRLFKSMAVEVDGFKFFFDVSSLNHKKNNEKRSLIYELKEVKEDKTIVFSVLYSEKGKKTKTDEILKELKKKGVKITEEILEKAFKVFEKQSEVDYFINKNAKEFLKEQFDLWLYQYVFSGNSEWTEKRTKQLQVLKDIAYKVIDFISQFEDELVKIWNKPKFVLSSNYVITLDRIIKKEGGIEVIEKILNHKNFDKQVEEWKDLSIVNEDFRKKEIFENTQSGKQLSAKYQFLPIDTKYFKDLELEILGLFDDLDNSLDGWLIKSENYQALNTILPKFKEKVQTIYIDPPFNTGDDFLYVDRFQYSSWLSLMNDRLNHSKNFLNNQGLLFLHLDYHSNHYGKILLYEIFKEENLRNEIIWNYKGTTNSNRFFAPKHDTIFMVSKNEDYLFNADDVRIPYDDEEKFEKDENGKYFQWWEKGKRYYPAQKLENGEWVLLGKYQYDVWNDIPSMATAHGSEDLKFPTQKKEKLLERIIKVSSNEGDLILDFFLGSGTTTAVAHKLKRKWIGVEMGEHFYTVVLPRMKKVLFYDKSGISKEEDVKKKYNEKSAGGFFKYYELEQYEDTLKRVKYEDTDLFNNPYQDPYNQYIFMKDLKMLEALEIDYENNKVKVDLTRLYENIDIAETLSNLLGKWIKKITPEYVEFEDGEKVNIKDLDYKLIKNLIWW